MIESQCRPCTMFMHQLLTLFPPTFSYYDCTLSVSSVMNLFAEHGWQLVSVFHAQVPHTLDAKPSPCDILVFSHSTNS